MHLLGDYRMDARNSLGTHIVRKIGIQWTRSQAANDDDCHVATMLTAI